MMGQHALFDFLYGDTLVFEITTLEERALTIIHELSHVGRVSHINAVGPRTLDFFYLDEEDPGKDSDKIVQRGLMDESDLIDPIALFNEIAQVDQLPVVRVDQTVMVYTVQQKREFMVARQARHRFEQDGPLRTRIASRNADSLAYGARGVAAHR